MAPMDALRFLVPFNAGIAVLVADGEEPAALDGARVAGIPRSGAEDVRGLIERLRRMRAEEGFEFLLVPSRSREWLEAHADAATLGATFEPLGTDDAMGALYSLFERPPDAHTAPDGLPLPPAHLIRVTSGCARQARNSPERMYRSFFDTGREGAGWIRAMVARAGADVGEIGPILDFGCGCGRVIRHWADLGDVSVQGTDYNPYLVRWCADNLPFARFGVNRLDPPLDHDENRFGLVYAISIFTHLDRDMQRPWIEALARVVRPGGYLLVTVNGTERATDLLNPRELARFDAGELVVKRSELTGMNACAAFHPARAIEDVLARGLDLVEHVPGGATDVRQDAVLLGVPG